MKKLLALTFYFLFLLKFSVFSQSYSSFISIGNEWKKLNVNDIPAFFNAHNYEFLTKKEGKDIGSQYGPGWVQYTGIDRRKGGDKIFLYIKLLYFNGLKRFVTDYLSATLQSSLMQAILLNH